jgi:hypothetical protein
MQQPTYQLADDDSGDGCSGSMSAAGTPPSCAARAGAGRTARHGQDQESSQDGGDADIGVEESDEDEATVWLWTIYREMVRASWRSCRCRCAVHEMPI